MPQDLKVAFEWSRYERAQEILRVAQKRLTKGDFFEIMDALGWFDTISYSPEGKMEVTLTEVQEIALAAALVAVLEAKGRWP